MATLHDDRNQKNERNQAKPAGAALRDERAGTSVHVAPDGRTVERIEPKRAPGGGPSAAGGNGSSAGPASRGLPDLLRELRDEAVTLVRQELHLARTEMSEKVSEAQRTLSASAVGLALALSGMVTLTLGAAAGLYAALVALEVDNMIAGWVAPVAVGVVVLAIGAVLASRARKLGEADHWRPKHTERSMRETQNWAENKV